MSGGCLGFLNHQQHLGIPGIVCFFFDYAYLGCRYPRWAYPSLGLGVMNAPKDGVLYVNWA